VDDQALAAQEAGLQTVGDVLQYVQRPDRLVVQVLVDGSELAVQNRCAGRGAECFLNFANLTIDFVDAIVERCNVVARIASACLATVLIWLSSSAHPLARKAPGKLSAQPA